jgi:hypothetical protein
MDHFQVMTPYSSGLAGTFDLNDLFQMEFKAEVSLDLAKGLYKEADKIIRTKNYYVEKELVLSNGSIGLIKEDDGEKLYFQEKDYEPISLKEIRKAEREYFELAYAITIHKSQGSGFDHTFVVVPDRPGLLSRELLYTAFTRCKKSATILIQHIRGKPMKKNLLELARTRTFTDSRRTSLLLKEPFRYYSLEPETGTFVQSRTELMIYHALKKKREELRTANFDFLYEAYPVDSKGKEVRIKTDFTITAGGRTWYWEHLGRLGNRLYDRNWHKLKRPTYVNSGLEMQLLTTDELRGLAPDKIDNIINMIAGDSIATEDKTNKYSTHHYSLR